MSMKDDLLKHSLIMFIATGILAGCGYLFHFYTANALGPEEYGIIGALISLLYIFTVPKSTLQVATARFISKYKAKNEIKKINSILRAILKYVLIFDVLLIIALFILSPIIADFLNIKQISFVWVIIMVLFITLILPTIRGALQGMQNFNWFGLSLGLEGILKLSIAFILVTLGFRVSGALGGLAFGLAIVAVISVIPIRTLFKDTKQDISLKEVTQYLIPILIMFACIAILLNIDVVLVKHFFSSEETGFYSIASLFGKVFFFVSTAVGNAMFPKVSELHTVKKNHAHLLHKSLTYNGVVAFLGVVLCTLFPNQVINLLFGQEYLPVVELLPKFSIALAIFSFFNIFLFYFISHNRMKILPILIFFTILEPILILMYHNSLIQIINILIVIMSFLFITTFLYYSWRPVEN